jgi:hypothetical protein
MSRHLLVNDLLLEERVHDDRARTPGCVELRSPELLRRSPEVARRVVFMTGGAIGPKLAEFLQTVTNERIQKPFSVHALRSATQRLLLAAARA